MAGGFAQRMFADWRLLAKFGAMKEMRFPKLPDSWMEAVGGEFEKDYMLELRGFLDAELAAGKTIYPPQDEIFSAFEKTDLEKVQVVIIGQDPYHGPGQAHGLSFSVKEGVRFPPSLRNILKELDADVATQIPERSVVSGDLSKWAQQGVLLLNAVLTVEAGQAASHQKKGWEQFSDKVIEVINDRCENVVFVLWGSFAQKKGKGIDRNRHFVLESVHPSPLSAHRGFFGSKPFSKINEYLESKGHTPIDWRL